MQQALAAMQSRPKPSLPMPSKRTSVMARSPERPERTTSSNTNAGSGGIGGGESSSDEDSVVTEESPGAGGPSGTGLSDTSSTGSARDTPPPPRPPARRPPADITDIAEYTPHAYCNLVQPPDVTHTSRRPAGEEMFLFCIQAKFFFSLLFKCIYCSNHDALVFFFVPLFPAHIELCDWEKKNS